MKMRLSGCGSVAELVLRASELIGDGRGIPLSLDDVQRHHVIVGYRRGQPLSWRVSDRAEPFRYLPPATHQFSDGVTMIQGAIAGIGLLQTPLSLVRQHIEAGSLVTVLDRYTQDPVDVHAVWPKVAHLRPKVRSVVDELIELRSAGALD